ncbi:MAG: ABC transporter permease, partial [Chloroflexota bacterium]
MIKFLIRRILFTMLTMFIVSVLVFALTEIAPGNIARNTLGNLITPEQEASFNRQNGLDQPLVARYLRWIFGSDWQAARLIGHSVVRLYDPSNDRYSWWVVDENGAAFQNYTIDSETIIKVVRQA